jgi:hypothetical protein
LLPATTKIDAPNGVKYHIFYLFFDRLSAFFGCLKIAGSLVAWGMQAKMVKLSPNR